MCSLGSLSLPLRFLVNTTVPLHSQCMVQVLLNTLGTLSVPGCFLGMVPIPVPTMGTVPVPLGTVNFPLRSRSGT